MSETVKIEEKEYEFRPESTLVFLSAQEAMTDLAFRKGKATEAIVPILWGANYWKDMICASLSKPGRVFGDFEFDQLTTKQVAEFKKKLLAHFTKQDVQKELFNMFETSETS